MTQRIGTCSLCGGDVYGYVGAWYGVTPPPPPECSSCGARTADDVIEMVPGRRKLSAYQRITTTTAPDPDNDPTAMPDSKPLIDLSDTFVGWR